MLFLWGEVKEQFLYADFARGAFLHPKQAILARQEEGLSSSLRRIIHETSMEASTKISLKF
jgi:hypothetical protein